MAHVFLDDQGRAWIDDTAYRVSMVVGDTFGPDRLTPEQIVENHYNELTLGQVFAALSYYHDHRAELDEQIEQEIRHVEAMRAEAEKDPKYQELMERVRRKREELGRPSATTLDAPHDNL
jgi:uncharacterized protein (DUF433 family)